MQHASFRLPLICLVVLHLGFLVARFALCSALLFASAPLLRLDFLCPDNLLDR